MDDSVVVYKYLCSSCSKIYPRFCADAHHRFAVHGCSLLVFNSGVHYFWVADFFFGLGEIFAWNNHLGVEGVKKAVR